VRDEESEAAVDRARGGWLKGRRLLVSVVLAWTMAVASMASGGQFLILLVWPVLGLLWLLPLWLLPRGPGAVRYAAPFLLFGVLLVLVGSSIPMTDPLRAAMQYRERVNSERGAGRAASAYVLDQSSRYEEMMAVVNEGMAASVAGGALAALLEVLGLYCWTKRMPAQRWSIAVLLLLFGPAVAAAMFLFSG
jgi:hypothetical protein